MTSFHTQPAFIFSNLFLFSISRIDLPFARLSFSDVIKEKFVYLICRIVNTVVSLETRFLRHQPQQLLHHHYHECVSWLRENSQTSYVTNHMLLQTHFHDLLCEKMVITCSQNRMRHEILKSSEIHSNFPYQ